MLLSLELLQVSMDGDHIVVIVLEVVGELGGSTLGLHKDQSECIWSSSIEKIHQVRSLLVLLHPDYLKCERCLLILLKNINYRKKTIAFRAKIFE